MSGLFSAAKSSLVPHVNPLKTIRDQTEPLTGDAERKKRERDAEAAKASSAATAITAPAITPPAKMTLGA